jgi:hypothetical protein
MAYLASQRDFSSLISISILNEKLIISHGYLGKFIAMLYGEILQVLSCGEDEPTFLWYNCFTIVEAK